MNIIASIQHSYTSWLHFSQENPTSAKIIKKTIATASAGGVLYLAFKTHPIATFSILFLGAYLYFNKKPLPAAATAPTSLSSPKNSDDQDALSMLDAQQFERETAAKAALDLLKNDRSIPYEKAEKLCQILGIKDSDISSFCRLPTTFVKANFPSPAKAIEWRNETFWELLKNNNALTYECLTKLRNENLNI